MNGASPMSLHRSDAAGKQKKKIKGNKMETQQQWRKFNGQKLKHSIQTEVENVLLQAIADGVEINVCIGTESQVKGKETEFATVIVFYRKGKGGFLYITNASTFTVLSIKERMLKEVEMSIDIAYRLSELFNKYNTKPEIHVDINTSPGFKSNTALKDAMGFILGMGFAFKAKPEAFASSSCANKMVQ
jgi:predicted RNase H-related nuclease YkuK (DUF458 family)